MAGGDGLGGFASGTVSGIRTRRYHALLLASLTPPTCRFVFVNGFDAWVEAPAGTFYLSSQCYAPNVIHPEDLASPGIFRWDICQGEAVWILATEGQESSLLPVAIPAKQRLQTLRAAERLRRRRFLSALHRAADAYIVRRGEGKTILAGYPWFTDWGRDTFISLRGLCLATSRVDDALKILLEWADLISDGMLPNRFPDQGSTPEFNSVDASLWYIIAVHDFLQAMKARRRRLLSRDRETLRGAVEVILAGHVKGTRYGIHP